MHFILLKNGTKTLSLNDPSAPYDVESRMNKQLAKVSSFNNSIQNISLMMKYYELEEKKNKKQYTKYKLINNIINSTDGLIILGTPSASVTLSITGVGIIVVPITAGVGCATGILVKICSSHLKKKEQNYKLKYAIIQKTLDDFRQFFTTSVKDNHIDEKEYHRFVNKYENYRVASQSQNITNKRAKQRAQLHDTTTPTTTLTMHMPSHKPSYKPYNFL